MLTRRTFALLPALLLAGCSYRPLYEGGASGTVAGQLSGIAIEDQKSRAGQLLRNELLSTMVPPGSESEARHRLSLKVAEREAFVSSLPKEPVSRRRLILVVQYRLLDIASGKVTAEGSSQSAVGYDAVREPVADLQARNAAMQRAALDVAQDVRLRLSAHFART